MDEVVRVGYGYLYEAVKHDVLPRMLSKCWLSLTPSVVLCTYELEHGMVCVISGKDLNIR